MRARHKKKKWQKEREAILKENKYLEYINRMQAVEVRDNGLDSRVRVYRDHAEMQTFCIWINVCHLDTVRDQQRIIEYAMEEFQHKLSTHRW